MPSRFMSTDSTGLAISPSSSLTATPTRLAPTSSAISLRPGCELLATGDFHSYTRRNLWHASRQPVGALLDVVLGHAGHGVQRLLGFLDALAGDLVDQLLLLLSGDHGAYHRFGVDAEGRLLLVEWGGVAHRHRRAEQDHPVARLGCEAA